MDVSPADSGLVTATVGDVTAAVISCRKKRMKKKRTGQKQDDR